MMMVKFYDHFWVTNITNTDISLSDLGITLRANRTVNLLDKRYYNFNKEQLELSERSGSLFARKQKIIKRKIPYIVEKKQLLEVDFNAVVPSRRRSIVKIEEVYYEELDISDDVFAETAADLVDQNYNK